MNAQKNKGDRAEREACIYLTAATGYVVERRFGAGAELDKGDLIGIPNTVVQVCDMKNKSEAVLRKPREAEQQRLDEEDAREIAEQARDNEIARMYDIFGPNLAAGMLSRQDRRQATRALRGIGADRATARYINAAANVDHGIYRMDYETDEDYIDSLRSTYSEGDME